MHTSLQRFPTRLAYALAAGLAALLGAAAPAAAQFVHGIDVSTHQGVVNWTNVKNAGIQFAFAKATEGVDFVDSRFTLNMANAPAAGVYIGPYHYARPDSFENDPLDAAKEANDFVDAIQPYYNTPGFVLRPVVDMEESDLEGVANPKAFLSEWLRDFQAVVQSRLGFSAIVYSSTSYINSYYESNISQYPLWLANWNYAPPNVPPASADGIFNGWDFWQYTSTGSVGGISPVDRDVYQGTLAEMLAEFQGVAPHGDFDRDGDVDGADLSIWQRNVGLSGAAALFSRGNADGDWDVDAADLAIWKRDFAAAAAPAAAAIPEPTTAALVLVAIAPLAAARRLHRRAAFKP
jgi:GH25 family lysozyme M1 (1,4-beta-N-acetylmuramidase)